jgi:hypothetical protein
VAGRPPVACVLTAISLHPFTPPKRALNL